MEERSAALKKLLNRLATFDKSAMPDVVGGLKLLPNKISDPFLRLSIEMATGSPPEILDKPESWANTDIPEEERGSVISASMLLASLASEEATLDEIFSALEQQEFVTNSQIPQLRPIAEKFRSMGVQSTFPQQRLANAILPSLHRVGTAIDLRIRFRKAGPDLTVPIALILISTDTDNQELRFQASKSQLKMLIDKLNEALEDLNRAESYMLKK